MTNDFNFSKTALVAALGLLPVNYAFSQGIPDAGSLQQQIQQDQKLRLPSKSAPEKSRAPDAMPATTGIVITAKQFKFVGNTLLTNEQLAPLVSEYLNKPLDYNQLQEATAAIADAYREAGWIVKAYLPKQDVTDGIITIQIIEAVFGGSRLETQSTRINQQQIQQYIEAAQAANQPLNEDDLERAILLIDDLPGIAAAAILQKGAGENQTDVAVKLTDQALFSGEVGGDNFGYRATGGERLTAKINVNSPSGIGDQISGNMMHSDGSDYGRLAYTLPVGNDGWRVGINGSYLAYNLVQEQFKDLEANGTSQIYGAEASYPLIRSRMKNLYFAINFDHKQFNNLANQVKTSDYEMNNVSVGLNGNLYDNIAGGGANTAGITLTQGDLNLGKLDLSENPALNGKFTKVNYSLSRQQVITENTTAYVGFSGQVATTNLNSAEQLYLGGASGVRAYPANEGWGSEGQVVNVELRNQLPYGFNFTPFYDLGHIRRNANNSANVTPNSYTLQGAGVSIAWQASYGLNLKATWARRIGDNPNPGMNGKDQDGTLHPDRFWLQASMPF